MRIGFLINPIAGAGGPLGLGGSDGMTVDDFENLNARLIAPERAETALTTIKAQPCFKSLEFLTCSGSMGADVMTRLGIDHKVVLTVAPKTNQNDTVGAAAEFKNRKVELIIFVGGDGTARDICSIINRDIPIIGVPSGVKMHSSVFLTRPSDAGIALQIYFEIRKVVDAEVMDVDEEAFRAGRVSARLYCLARVPDIADHRQSTKSVSDGSSESEELEELAEYFLQSMDDRTLYVLGTGSTLGAISRKFGIEKNELTVNAVIGGKEIGQKLDENSILSLLGKYDRVKIVVTPIGGQGFIFGRGNQQLSAKVLSKIRNEDIVVVATPTKLGRLESLRVDTGDHEIDNRLRGYWKVMTGYGKFRVMKVQ
ncbi:MAG: ATP-NAD kinase family protein [Thermoplasmata archaeon]